MLTFPDRHRCYGSLDGILPLLLILAVQVGTELEVLALSRGRAETRHCEFEEGVCLEPS